MGTEAVFLDNFSSKYRLHIYDLVSIQILPSDGSSMTDTKYGLCAGLNNILENDLLINCFYRNKPGMSGTMPHLIPGYFPPPP